MYLNYKCCDFKRHRCLKPSLFNPKREELLLSQDNNSKELTESLFCSLKRWSNSLEKTNDNYFKIAVMNAAYKFDYPADYLNYLKEKHLFLIKHNEGDHCHVKEEEELLKNLYNAPEIN